MAASEPMFAHASGLRVGRNEANGAEKYGSELSGLRVCLWTGGAGAQRFAQSNTKSILAFSTRRQTQKGKPKDRNDVAWSRPPPPLPPRSPQTNNGTRNGGKRRRRRIGERKREKRNKTISEKCGSFIAARLISIFFAFAAHWIDKACD